MGNYIKRYINENSTISKEVFQFYEMISKLQWNANGNSVNHNKWMSCFALLESTNSVQICLNSFPHTIIKTICEIKFISLQRLNLSQNNIENIQSLQFLECPQLKKLELNDNKITSIKTFNKYIQVKQMSHLNLSQNPLLDIEKLFGLKAKYLQQIVLQKAFLTKYQNSIKQSISIFVKLQTNFLREVYIQNQNRIQQLSVYNQIKNKNPEIMMRRLNFMKY